ncbi:MAG: 3-deoxy-D-manno-octulosonic acid kinase [Candidatus Binatota bacterium]|nr:3-deoxy-D-manno-octulosonic acid kinase [Candidatus Binatota bacterium]
MTFPEDLPERAHEGPNEPAFGGGHGGSHATEWVRVVEDLDRTSEASARSAFDRGEDAGARLFLLEPLRGFARGLCSRGAGRFGRAVVGGYAAVVHAMKLWELDRRWREMRVVELRRGRSLALVERPWRRAVSSILDGDLRGQRIEGGRGGTTRKATDRGPVVIRVYRRGGAMRWLGRTYFGPRARPLREFWLLLSARRRSLPVPEPVAAIVERGRWLGISYRGVLVMAEAAGAPLWDVLSAGGRRDVLPALGRSLRRLHEAGLTHPDLNLRNILVTEDGAGPAFTYVDLDGARLGAAPNVRTRRRSLQRIRRSARKLDPAGRLVLDEDLGRLERAYWQDD